MSVAGINVLVDETRARMDAAKAPLLSVRGVSAYYGSIRALKNVDIDVHEGEIVALIGANGAGKSTLMMTIFGQPQAREGTITFAGQDITKLPTHEIARLNLAQSPEGRRIFSRMTVRENLQMGAAVNGGKHFAEDLERMCTLFPRLRERIDQRGGTMSGGEQQMLAIARGMMARPRILLLDEPSLGLAPAMINALYAVVADLRDQGVTILIVDQMAALALTVADRGYVLEQGRVVTAGTAAELGADAGLEAAYLGAA